MVEKSRLVLEKDEQRLWRGEPAGAVKPLIVLKEVLAQRTMLIIGVLSVVIISIAQLFSPSFLTPSTNFCLYVVLPVGLLMALIKANKFVNCNFCVTNKRVVLLRDELIDEQITFEHLERIMYFRGGGIIGHLGSRVIFYSDEKASILGLLEVKKQIILWGVDCPSLLHDLPPHVREAALASAKGMMPKSVREIGKISDKSSQGP